jgi:membrane protease YdiL (CAAX protease family)
MRVVGSTVDEPDVLRSHPRLSAAFSTMMPPPRTTTARCATMGCILLRLLVTGGVALAGLCALVALDRFLSEVAPAPRATHVQFVAIAGQDVVVLPFCFLMTWAWGSSSAALGWRRPTWHGWVLATIGSVLLLFAIDRVLGSLLLPHATQEFRAYLAPSYAFVHPAPVYDVILACGIGPLAEETLFRGVVFQGLRRILVALCGSTSHVVPVAAAMVISAVVFGLAHGDGLVLAVPRMVHGLVYAALCQRYNSLWPAVAAHALGNAVAVHELAAL